MGKTARRAALGCALILLGTTPAHAGVKEFVKKIFKVALGGKVTMSLPGPYPLGPTPLVLRDGKLTVTKSGVEVRIKLTAIGVPLCTAKLEIDSSGVAVSCHANFKVFKAHLAGHLDFSFKRWGLSGGAALSILGRKLGGLHIELSNEGFRAVFTILGIDLSVGPVSAGDLWSAIKRAALAILNPFELAKKAAKAVGRAARKVGRAVADGARAVGRGAKAAAKKIGSVLSKGARAIFGGGSLMEQVKKLQAKKVAEQREKNASALRRARAKAAAFCEAQAATIVKQSGIDGAVSAAERSPMKLVMKLPPFGCDLVAKVRSIVRKLRTAVAAVRKVTTIVENVSRPASALAMVKSRGLVGFYRCAVVQKSRECADLWPHLNGTLRELAKKHASKTKPKKRYFGRRRRSAPARTASRSGRATKAAAPRRATKATAPRRAPAKRAARRSARPTGRIIQPPVPVTVRLAQGLGFRVAPGLKSKFVMSYDRYIERGNRVRVLSIEGEPGKEGTYCRAMYRRKTGYIRCDGAYFR